MLSILSDVAVAAPLGFLGGIAVGWWATRRHGKKGHDVEAHFDVGFSRHAPRAEPERDYSHDRPAS